MTPDPLREQYPTLFYHVVTAATPAMQAMGDVRTQYLALAQTVLDLCPPGRSKSLALTHLEDSLMRAIQRLALTGELVDPRPGKEPGGDASPAAV